MVQGGYYLKGFAKHGPLHNPHTYGYFGPIAYQGAKQGGHVTPGGIIYKGDAFPAAFRGAFIGGNLLSNAVYWHVLKQDGSTFARPPWRNLDRRPRPLVPADRPAGRSRCGRVRRRLVRQAGRPSRSARHLGSHQRPNLSRRLRRAPEGAPFDLAKRSSAELVALRESTNDWFAAEARRILAERRDPAIVPTLKSLLHDDRDETIALRDLWALNASGGLDDGIAAGIAGASGGRVRRWTIRLLGDDHRMNSRASVEARGSGRGRA